MNIDHIMKTADLIESADLTFRGVPVGFNMASWISTGGYYPDHSGHGCGTTACIAGWATLASGAYQHKSVVEENAYDYGRRYFGIDRDQASALFSGSPLITDGVHDPHAVPTSEMAVLTLRHFAMTGEISWKYAYHATAEQKQELCEFAAKWRAEHVDPAKKGETISLSGSAA